MNFNLTKLLTMKKRILLFMVLAASAASMFAQETIQPIVDRRSYRLSFGAKVGGNMTLMSGDPTEGVDMNYKTGYGFQLGLVLNERFGRASSADAGGTGKIGAQVEVLYSQQQCGTADKNLKINLIEMPVLFQYYPLQNAFIELGPTFVSSTSASPDELNVNSVSFATKDIKYKDVLLTAGVGYLVNAGAKTKISIDFRYNAGMSDLAGNFKTKMSTFQLSYGVLFNL